MKSERLFLIDRNRTIKQAMRQLSDLGEKELFVITENDRLLGALRDGDIRKCILKEGSLYEPVERICNKTPKYVDLNYDLEDVKSLMLNLKIECIPVVDKNSLIVKVLTWDEVFAGKIQRSHERLNIPVVIMAGGKGSRVDPLHGFYLNL